MTLVLMLSLLGVLGTLETFPSTLLGAGLTELLLFIC